MSAEIVVARVGKPHGLRGEATVQVHTDAPDERLAPGESYAVRGLTGAPGVRPPSELTISTVRVHNGIWLLGFDGYPDRTAAESLRGARLVMTETEDETGGWYESELAGLPVHDTQGARIGEVTGLDIGVAQDRLAVRLDDGRTGLVPFVEALVPLVQVDGDTPHVVVDAPDGLFDLDS